MASDADAFAHADVAHDLEDSGIVPSAGHHPLCPAGHATGRCRCEDMGELNAPENRHLLARAKALSMSLEDLQDIYSDEMEAEYKESEEYFAENAEQFREELATYLKKTQTTVYPNYCVSCQKGLGDEYGEGWVRCKECDPVEKAARDRAPIIDIHTD